MFESVKNLPSVAIIALLGVSAAHGAVDIDFDTGYITGEIVGQGTPAWSSASNIFEVKAGAGTNGSNALVTKTSSTTANSIVYTIDPNAMSSNAFSTATTIVSFSFNLELVSVGSTSGLLDRIWIGQNGSAFPVIFAINADKSITLANPSDSYKPIATTAVWSLATSGYHKVSGIIDYTSGQITVGVDSATPYTGNFIVPLTTSPANYTGYGIMKINRFTTNVNDVIAIDDIKMAVVPEPAALAILAVGGLSLCGARRSRTGK